MIGDEIRDGYLRFFEEKGHKVVPSSSLVPHKDPTLLLTTAGMVQMKPYFLGLEKPENPRLASCQKCFRTTDIDCVGDSKHLTFFEMLGNFSVGEYFKKEAIAWAWEYVTGRLKLPGERLWTTVFRDDDEAYNLWRKIGVPESRITRLGERENFWGPAGDSGPCGPCSEIHYDFGADVGCCRPECDPGCSCGRFIEVWNLVFTEYNQDREGKRVPLPKPNIDTGMGLERVVAVVTGKDTVYQTDFFTPLLDKVCAIAGKTYGKDEAVDQAVRVVAEHGRGISFLIGDGVLPSNEGRGYVLRRILRRASLFGRRLGLHEPFLGEITDAVVARMGRIYPELVANQAFIKEVIKLEEERFNATLDTGLNLLEKYAAEAASRGEKQIAGSDVFRLYDTYGFPRELTEEVARDKGLAIDSDGFEKEMERQRERARAGRQVAQVQCALGNDAEHQKLFTVAEQQFVGYDCLSTTTEIVWLSVSPATKDAEVDIVLHETPFYAEMGGQVGDTGEIVSATGKAVVTNTVKDAHGLIVHKGKVVEGTLSPGPTEAKVDMARRLDIARNHTATHLLQAALRKVAGKQVAQKGSLVSPERLRFDFSQLTPLTRDQLAMVQREVNKAVRDNLPVSWRTVPFQQAIAEGATALFEEKYGDVVRQVRVGDPPLSNELCGGTHVTATGDIGFFVLTSEGSIGAGLRRIEAVTGRGAEALVEERLGLLDALSARLKVSTSEILHKMEDLQARVEGMSKEIEQQERASMRREVDGLVRRVEDVNGAPVLAVRVNVSSVNALREMGDLLRDRLKSGVIAAGTVVNDRPNFVVMVTPDLVARGVHAGNIIKEVARVAGGGGGGKPDLAQAGGKDASKIDEALGLVRDIVKGKL